MTQIAEKPNRVQGMARSFDQWLNMVPHAVADGSKAQVECALADASHDIEVLWRKVTSQAAEIERLRERLTMAQRLMTKDSFCEGERLDEGLRCVREALTTGAAHE